MSFARYAQKTTPLTWRPPPLPKKKPEYDDHLGIFLGRRYRLNGHPDYVFVPERPSEGSVRNSHVYGLATNRRDNTTLSLDWAINRLTLLED